MDRSLMEKQRNNRYTIINRFLRQKYRSFYRNTYDLF